MAIMAIIPEDHGDIDGKVKQIATFFCKNITFSIVDLITVTGSVISG